MGEVRLDAKAKSKRPVSAHRLPVDLSARPVRATSRQDAPQAAFLAQLLTTTPPHARQAMIVPSREIPESRLYRQAEMSDTRRLPAGYRKRFDA